MLPAPAGTPRSIIERIHADLARVISADNERRLALIRDSGVTFE